MAAGSEKGGGGGAGPALREDGGARPAVIKGWRPSPEEREAHYDGLVLPDPADAKAIETGDWRRTSGALPCSLCGAALWRHDMVRGALWLIRDCNGKLWKP